MNLQLMHAEGERQLFSTRFERTVRTTTAGRSYTDAPLVLSNDARRLHQSSGSLATA